MNEYRIFCETFVFAESEDKALEIGYEKIKNEDYRIEEVN